MLMKVSNHQMRVALHSSVGRCQFSQNELQQSRLDFFFSAQLNHFACLFLHLSSTIWSHDTDPRVQINSKVNAAIQHLVWRIPKRHLRQADDRRRERSRIVKNNLFFFLKKKTNKKKHRTLLVRSFSTGCVSPTSSIFLSTFSLLCAWRTIFAVPCPNRATNCLMSAISSCSFLYSFIWFSSCSARVRTYVS
jgi:hypothetical protein